MSIFISTIISAFILAFILIFVSTSISSLYSSRFNYEMTGSNTVLGEEEEAWYHNVTLNVDLEQRNVKDNAGQDIRSDRFQK